MQIHCGIRFSVRKVEPCLWAWTIDPPESVKGLTKARGEILGNRTDAEAAAKHAIEVQVRRINPYVANI